MDIPDIKTIIKGNKVFFDSYRQGYFYYNVRIPEIGKVWQFYQFPVPLDDIGTATMLGEDNAITYMRWIRKAVEEKTFIKL